MTETCRAFVSPGTYTRESRRCQKSDGLKDVVIPKPGRSDTRVRLCQHHVDEFNRKGPEILAPRKARR